MTGGRAVFGEISAEKIPLDRGELKRRLGDDFESTLSKYSDTVKALFAAVKIRYAVGEASLSVDGNTARIGDVGIDSAALSRHLSGYKSCAVIALTLGTSADRFIKRCEAQSPALGFVADAISSAIADSACYAIVGELWGEGCHSAPFAVGYADTDTDSLPHLLKIADPFRRLGITFTDAHLMIPTKSIIVIVGKM